MKNLLTLFLAILFAAQLSLTAQDKEEYIAKIENKKISIDKFEERYEFTPHLGRGDAKNEKSLISQFLYTLIAEKLWALKAQEVGIDKQPMVASALQAVEKMYARDALYKKEISDKVNISDEELADAVNKELSSLKLYYLKSRDKKEIDNLYYLLNSGYSFDSLLVARPEYAAQKNQGYLSFTDINQTIVDSVYKLNTGQFTKPIKLADFWFIFYVEAKETQMFSDAGSKGLVKKVTDKIRERKEAVLYKRYKTKLFKNRQVKVDGKLFHFIAKEFAAVLKNKPDIYDTLFIDSNDAYYLIKNIPQDTLNKPFIILDDNPVSVGEFIKELAFNTFKTSSYKIPKLEHDLNLAIRIFIEHEVLAREAYKLGYNSLPEVQEDVNMWKDYYMSFYYKNSLKDSISVTDKQVKEFLDNKLKENNFSDIELNIEEMLTDSLSVVQNVLAQVEKGADFSTLAIKHTKRDWVKKNNGEFGWFKVFQYPEIGKIALDMNINEIYGPLKTDNGFSVFKLIGKRETSAEGDKNYSELYKQAKFQLKEKLLSDTILRKTVQFANEYGFEINQKALNQIQPTHINAYFMKIFGFGGTMTAVPLITNFYEWVEYYKNQNKLPL